MDSITTIDWSDPAAFQLLLIPWGIHLGVALAIFIVGRWVANRLTGVVRRLMGRSRLGGIVSVQSENQSLNQSVYVVRNQGGFIHTPDTAFSVQASGSCVENSIQGFTTAQSPFLWPNGNTPPAIESNSDADLLVEIDCASDGNCNGGGDQTHLMIYNASCNIDGP